MITFGCLLLAGSLYVGELDGERIIQVNEVSKEPSSGYVYVAQGRRHMVFEIPEDHELYDTNAVGFARWCLRSAEENER